MAKFTKEEIRAACDKLVLLGMLKIVGKDDNGEPLYQETTPEEQAQAQLNPPKSEMQS